jgi:DNA-binding NtrC family response regulator
VRPDGSATAVPVDLRIITATHRDLERMVAEGSFRTDLFYRLNVVRIEIPPLRERSEDIPLLVHHFIAKYARAAQPIEGIEEAALDVLCQHDWPGNVRELENVIEAAIALAPGPRLRAADLPRERRAPSRSGSPAVALPLSLAAYERAAIERALAEAHGDAAAAARLLGIGRSTLYRKLARRADATS